MAYITMACMFRSVEIVPPGMYLCIHIVMAHIVMAYTGMACIVMAHTVRAYTVMPIQ